MVHSTPQRPLDDDDVVVLDPEDPAFSINGDDDAEKETDIPPWQEREMSDYQSDVYSQGHDRAMTNRRNWRPWIVSVPIQTSEMDLEERCGTPPERRRRIKSVQRPFAMQDARDEAGDSRTSASELMTTREVAQHLRVSTATVLRHCATGRLPSFRTSRRGHRRFRRADVDAALVCDSRNDQSFSDLDAFIRKKIG